MAETTLTRRPALGDLVWAVEYVDELGRKDVGVFTEHVTRLLLLAGAHGPLPDPSRAHAALEEAPRG